MEKTILYELKSLYRDNMRITGIKFGAGEKSAVIVGGVRGNEVQQMFVCSKLVQRLQKLEEQGKIVEGKSILVVPAINPYSINVEKRFWPTDNTDINRMFPGYSLGETTQRIAAGFFEAVKGYEYGIHFASNYIPGKFVPHVRVMETGWEDQESAADFGLKYTVIRKPRPYDTTTLAYNWQIWETKSFSLFTNQTDTIDTEDAKEMVNSVLNFLNNKGIVESKNHKGYISSVIDEEHMLSIKSTSAGIFQNLVRTNQSVRRGQVLAHILDPFDGSIKEEILAPENGIIFFVHSKSLAFASAVLFKMISD